ncbi:TPA: hypothetical protein KKW74_002690 [Legionella pneumophila]|uniref:hypothetical protein n=1 Tax=Legionella pneumophila TaxID=446 RepID=UPI0005B38D9C|nr:hypothetical protein [Legionella pneumophila]TIG73075.1 hypothetical protein DI119_15240 [Legionella pneumophila]HAT6979751.1 hypothetical protein [Legionella pneumophila]HAT7923569.1 hypothetical protein [Legionella pneumophila]HAT8803683.1 hypothetical protein [Legionella pneumophila]HAU1990778.1 hypothetical protein [Legionella pneumophila]
MQVDQDKNRAKVFLKSIQSEIENIFSIYNERAGKLIEELDDNSIFEFIFPIKQNYFNVYESQASLLGLVKSDHLRSSIIKCYIEMKGLVDGFLMNNTLLEKVKIYINRTDQDSQQHLNYLIASLANYAQEIKKQHGTIRELIQEISTEIDNYLE